MYLFFLFFDVFIVSVYKIFYFNETFLPYTERMTYDLRTMSHLGSVYLKGCDSRGV